MQQPPGTNGVLSVQPIDAEVVGASGRIGSQLLRLLRDRVRAVPKGLCPGSWTNTNENDNDDDQHGKPIFVATPAATWKEIHHVTLPHRRRDLVWVGNASLLKEPSNEDDGDSTLDMYRHATVVVPHYGILTVGALPTTSPQSKRNPVPTYIYGRHAAFTAALLEQDGISVEILSSWSQLQQKAAQKLVWASCLWLFCHAPDHVVVQEPKEEKHELPNTRIVPLSVTQVHQTYPQQLERLVQELWPILSNQLNGGDSPISTHQVLTYMQDYSESMPKAVPSLELAKAELQERNGVFFRSGTHREEQPYHCQLLQAIVGSATVTALQQQQQQQRSESEPNRPKPEIVTLPELNLSVYGYPRTRQRLAKNAMNVVIVGSGVLGTCIALNAARLGLEKITVVDQQPPSEAAVGSTTPASWAWLNANQKSPPASYQWLNHVGLLAWLKDPLLQNLPLWNGSLVQTKQPVDDAKTLLMGYPCQGPLTRSQIVALEPHCILDAGPYPTYFFAEEGCVDPLETVRVLRQSCRDHHKVTFRLGCQVESLVRNEEGLVTGVQGTTTTTVHNNTTTTSMVLPATVVVSAAGVGSAARSLGGIPLLTNPGTIVLGQPKEKNKDAVTGNEEQEPGLLSRVLVDAVNESHILQRRNGTIAVGGGYPQVGGVSAEQSDPSGADQSSSSLNATHLLSSAAKFLAPTVVAQLDPESLVTEQAIRPMPVDGYPSIGLVSSSNPDATLDPSLYSVVTHSGITLAPLLGALIAAEVYHNLDLVLLQPWRPQRFDAKKQATKSRL